MRTFVLFISTLFVISCSTPSDSNVKNGDIGNYGIAISAPAQEAVKSLQDMLKIYQNGESRSTTSPSFDALFRMDSTNVALLPYYEFNTDAFYENPAPENIIPNLSPSKDMYIALVENDLITASFRTHKTGTKWEIRGYTESCVRTLACLSDKFKESDSCDYKIFRCGGSEFYIFTINGKIVFYDSLGQTISGNKLCSTLLQLLNKARSGNEWLQKRFPKQ